MSKKSLQTKNKLTFAYKIADCLNEKTYGNTPLQLISFFEKINHDSYGDLLRIMTIPYLYHLCEKIYASKGNPVKLYTKGLEEYLQYVKSVDYSALKNIVQFAQGNAKQEVFDLKLETHTGQHYGSLFRQFDDTKYFKEAKELLQIRLKRNNVKINNLKEKSVLDQGCGGGRYTVAWRLLGAKESTGVDISDIGLEDARKRLSSAKIKNVNFVKSNVLSLPFSNNSFDIVFSNGVLHHTKNWKKGVAELLRVLKPGGIGWLYLIEKPGGLQWDNIEILRAINRNVNKVYAQNILKMLGIPSNRIFFMLDHVLVPINTRLRPEEIEKELLKNKATKIQRLSRGADFDGIEYIHLKKSYSKEKFGVGENRFIFTK